MFKKTLNRLLFGGAGGGNLAADVGLLLLRVTSGLFIAIGHGWGKITSPSDFIKGVDKMGFPAPDILGWLAILGEFFGGILLALGLLTRPAALWLICIYFGAAFVAHGSSYGSMADFFVPVQGNEEPAAEPAVLYLVIAVTFLLAGSGRTGGDRLLRKK